MSDIRQNRTAMYLLSLLDDNLILNFKDHKSEKDSETLKRNNRVIQHYKKQQPKMWSDLANFLNVEK